MSSVCRYVYKSNTITEKCYCYTKYATIGKHNKVKTFWPPFCRRNFQMNFLELNFRLQFHWSLLLRLALTIFEYWVSKWRRSGHKPFSWAMMVSLLTHICVTRPQWVNVQGIWSSSLSSSSYLITIVVTTNHHIGNHQYHHYNPWVLHVTLETA